jgi:uncharacterized protein YyaL (SSP411 family)
MIDWLGWDAAAFARATREQKPVLLSIAAAWCAACHEMDRTTYADAVVAALVHDRFVPVRVDADLRPDINERYNLGGWPTTAFLTPDGALMTGGTFVPADRMVAVLTRVADAFRDQPAAVVDREVEPESTPQDLSPDLVEATFSSFDGIYGGFGVEPKFPHTAPIHLALALFEDTGDSRWREIAERTLDGMADGGLWDAVSGGFRRYSTRRDWQLPHAEKLLETNGSLLRAYAGAVRTLGRDADRDRTAATAGFITTELRADRGGFRGSDAGTAVLADANAVAARGLFAAAAVLGDTALARAALDSFERVLLACYTPGSGLAHSIADGTPVRGLLTDQVDTIAALLDAHEMTGDEPYKMMAEELGHFVTRELWDGIDGGCFDRVASTADVGLLRTRRKPFVGNAEAATAFARLARLSHDFDFAPFAAGALTTAGQSAHRQGPLAAHYLLAVREVG